MEFSEKLQELRKNRGLTQEELAEALFVSRTAVSKWESGRGYPSIESLKEISKFFSITIDELLSGEKLLSIAEKENKSNMQNLCAFVIGIIDVFYFMLVALPLYPKTAEGYIVSVSLFHYAETAAFNRITYWILFIALIFIGVIEILFTQLKKKKAQKCMLIVSMLLSILTVIFLALTRETYATTLAFLLFVVKGFLLGRVGRFEA